MPLRSATPEAPVWLRVGTLLDGTSRVPATDAHVVYDSETIRFVGADGRTPPRELLRDSQQAPDLHAPDATLLPGLIEGHAHLFLEGGELDAEARAAHLRLPAEELLLAARGRLERLVRLGIAAVRDAGDKDGVGLALSRLYAEGPRPWMPYVESPGAAIHHRGRYGAFMAEPLENFPTPRDCVRARVAAGADRIKLIPTGIINFQQGEVTTPPQMALEEVAAIAAASAECSRQTFAHASGAAGIDLVIDGGVDSIEHGFFVRDDQLARMRDRRTAWIPTFAPVQKQLDYADRLGWDATVVSHLRRILDKHAASLVAAHQLGVSLVAGSDAGSQGVAHGWGLLEELELMERAGLPSLAVINSATGAGAARLGYKEPFGAIVAGHLSRLILAEYSPLETVSNLRRPRVIIFDGAIFETDENVDVGGL